MAAEPIGWQRAGGQGGGLDDEQKDGAAAQGVQRYQQEQHGLEVEGQQRIGPRESADVDLGVPGRALVDAHAEKLPAQEVGKHLVDKAKVLGVRAARKVALYREPAEKAGPGTRQPADDHNRPVEGVRLPARLLGTFAVRCFCWRERRLRFRGPIRLWLRCVAPRCRGGCGRFRLFLARRGPNETGSHRPRRRPRVTPRTLAAWLLASGASALPTRRRTTRCVELVPKVQLRPFAGARLDTPPARDARGVRAGMGGGTALFERCAQLPAGRQQNVSRFCRSAARRERAVGPRARGSSLPASPRGGSKRLARRAAQSEAAERGH